MELMNGWSVEGHPFIRSVSIVRTLRTELKLRPYGTIHLTASQEEAAFRSMTIST